MNRQEIFNKIDEERTYQENKWGVEFDDQNTINDWVTYINQYASHAARMNVGVDHVEENLIKVAALAVAALEAIDRNGGLPNRHYDE